MRKRRSNFILDTDFVEIIKKYWKYRYISIRIVTENFSILTPLVSVLLRYRKYQYFIGINIWKYPYLKYQYFSSTCTFQISKAPILFQYQYFTSIEKAKSQYFSSIWGINFLYVSKVSIPTFLVSVLSSIKNVNNFQVSEVSVVFKYQKY